MTQVWLEAALNGSWGRERQPLIPLSVRELIDDGIACADEGAAIIHLHTYDGQSGQPRVDAESYVRIIEAIREKRDVIVYPTIDSTRAPDGETTVFGAQRHAEAEKLATRKLIEWLPLDPGSVNLTAYASLKRNRTGVVYMNPESDVRAGLALCAQHALHPTYAIYEPGFLRLGAALAQSMLHVRVPVYRLMLSEGMVFGFPPREYSIRAYRALLEEYAPGAPWMLAGYALDPIPLIPSVVAAGGHVRVGLEDAPFGSERSNTRWVAHAAREIVKAGGGIATAAEVRASLAAAGAALS